MPSGRASSSTHPVLRKATEANTSCLISGRYTGQRVDRKDASLQVMEHTQSCQLLQSVMSEAEINLCKYLPWKITPDIVFKEYQTKLIFTQSVMLMFVSPTSGEVAGLQSEITLLLLSPRQGAVEYNPRKEGRAFSLCLPCHLDKSLSRSSGPLKRNYKLCQRAIGTPDRGPYAGGMEIRFVLLFQDSGWLSELGP